MSFRAPAAAIAPSGTQYEITHREQRAVIVEVGGGLRGYSVGDRDLLDGYGVDEICPSGRGQVLIPWPNRLLDGRYTFAGRHHQLALTEPQRRNAIHGLRVRPDCAIRSASCPRLREIPEDDRPFRIDAAPGSGRGLASGSWAFVKGSHPGWPSESGR